MNGIILAAGKGTRLRPLTYEKPKTLAQVGSTSILENLIRQYEQAGIDEVVIVTGYMAESVETVCSSLHEALDIDVSTVRNEDYETTDNLYSLYLGLERIRFEPFVVSNGDVVCDDAIIERAGASRGEAIVFYDSTDFQEEELKLELDHGRPTAILDKGKNNGAGATIGVFAFNEQAANLMFEDLEEMVLSDETGNWFEASLSNIFDQTDFEPVDVKDHRWIEIDTKEDLLRANELFNGNVDKAAERFEAASET